MYGACRAVGVDGEWAKAGDAKDREVLRRRDVNRDRISNDVDRANDSGRGQLVERESLGSAGLKSDGSRRAQRGFVDGLGPRTRSGMRVIEGATPRCESE